MLVLGQHDHLGAHGVLGEAREDERVAALAGRDHALIVDIRGALVVGEVERQAVDDARGAIGVLRDHLQRLRLVFAGEDDFVGNQRDAGDLRDGLGIVGRARLDPAQQRLVIFGVGFEAAAAGVRDRASGFQQQQTLFGNGEIEAAADDLLREAVVVARRIIAEERQMEAVLADGRAVASTAVAAGAEEDGHDVETKTGRGGLGRIDLAGVERAPRLEAGRRAIIASPPRCGRIHPKHPDPVC